MAKEIIKFLKCRNVKDPNRKYPTDAGIDFFVPKFDKEFVEDLKEKNEALFNSNVSNHSNINSGFAVANSGELQFTGGTGTGTCVTYDLNDYNETIFKFDEEKGELYFILVPHARVLIPSGLHSRMAKEGRALIAANKSGIASKKGVIFGAQVVDYTYQGEIHINVINTSTENVRIYENMKLIQFIETPIFNNEIKVITEDDEDDFIEFYKNMKRDRECGGFGSTDTEQINS